MMKTERTPRERPDEVAAERYVDAPLVPDRYADSDVLPDGETEPNT